VVASFLISLWLLGLWEGREQILQTIVVKNSTHRVAISHSMPSDPAKARAIDGYALAVTSLVPKEPHSLVRVHVRTYIQSERLSTAILAVFRDGTDEPIGTFTRKPSSARVEEMIALFDVPATGTAPVGLTFRIGPEDAGSMMLNGAPGGAGIESIITLREIKTTN
jgi:hypothetical protein